MAAYFALTLTIFPNMYENTKVAAPQPIIETTLSEQQIKLGESFELLLTAKNQGQEADLQTVTVEFPQNQNLDNVKILSYDFLQSPKLFLQENEVGSGYTGGQGLVKSKYPFIEAYSRPSKTGQSYTMTLQITPTESGTFTIYSKTVAMPHVNEASHFPTQGILDHQNEFVLQHTVEVVP